jgi:TetR/AcrR family transcriptional regulator, copper-responsive repressor
MGELPDDINARALATFYAAVLQGMSAQARDGATRAELIEIATAALRGWPTALPARNFRRSRQR